MFQQGDYSLVVAWCHHGDYLVVKWKLVQAGIMEIHGTVQSSPMSNFLHQRKWSFWINIAPNKGKGYNKIIILVEYLTMSQGALAQPRNYVNGD